MLSQHRDHGSLARAVADGGGRMVPGYVGQNAVRMAAAMLMVAANAYAAPMLHRVTIRAAAMNGPMNSPIRKLPPRVERARARNGIGIASVR